MDRDRYAVHKYEYEMEWVKAHDGDPGNERADYLANLGVDSVS